VTTDTIADRFWDKVEKTRSCWLWTGGRSGADGGYGQMATQTGKAPKLAHRVSWEINRGPIPRGKSICHRCDNTICVRPSHLFIGSQADNSHDMWRKGRGKPPPRLPGEASGKAKLTWANVRAIRRQRTGGATLQAIGDKYGVTATQVWHIVKNKHWVE
jgi:hypothetical protein